MLGGGGGGGVSVYPLSCTMYMNLYGTCVGHS